MSMGVPYRTFMGDGDGGGWTPFDRDIVVAWLEYQDGLCGGCGTPKSHAWTREADGRWEGAARTCRVCRAIDETEQRWRAEGRSPHVKANTAGIKFLAVPKATDPSR